MSISPPHLDDFKEKIIDWEYMSMQDTWIIGSLMDGFRSTQAESRLEVFKMQSMPKTNQRFSSASVWLYSEEIFSVTQFNV